MNTRFIAILEDEKEPSELLKSYLIRYADEKKLDLQISQFFDVRSFFDGDQQGFDIIFLDIMLPDGNGMDVAKKIREVNQKSLLIFVTNMANYAINGYEVGAFDYILKPINYDSFVFKFERAYAIIETNKEMTMTVKHGIDMKVLEVAKIMYIEVDDHQIQIHLTDETISTSGRLIDFVDKLKALPFELCNQSFLVNMRYITGIKDDSIIIGKDQLRISRPRKKLFLKAFNDYLGS